MKKEIRSSKVNRTSLKENEIDFIFLIKVLMSVKQKQKRTKKINMCLKEKKEEEEF